MKKNFTGIAPKIVFKKTGRKLILMLAAFIWSAVMPMVLSAEWTVELVDEHRTLNNFYQRAIAIDSFDRPHIAYGDNHLYYAYFDGTQWQDEIVDNALDVGAHASIAIDSNDNVHISYYDGVNGDLKYATNASGAWVIETVDTEGDVGGETSIAIGSNNNLHIGYYDYTNGDLKYAMKASGAWVVETVDAQGDVGQYSSIAIDSSDNMHISYYDETNYNLKYAMKASGAWVVETLDSQGDIGQYTSIATDSNDNVHISYYDETNYNLKYATNISDAWVIETVDTGNVGTYTGFISSIAIDSNDNVHISYRNLATTTLKYATNISGDWITITVDSEFSSWPFGRQYSSIAIDSNDNVHIGYYVLYSRYNNWDVDYVNGILKYATNASGAWVIEPIDAKRRIGLSSSIAIDSNNNMHISYVDGTFNNLKYVTNVSGVWVIETVTEGGGTLSPYIAIDSSDNVHISYYDYTNGAIKYVTNTSGVWVIETVYEGEDIGRYTSISIDSNYNVHISYSVGTWPDYKLKYATNTSGVWVIETIDTESRYSSIAIDSNNNVHISYRGNVGLKYATNASGFWALETLDTEGSVGSNTYIAIGSNNSVHISYYVSSPFSGDLRYITNTSGVWMIETIDEGERIGLYHSMAIDSSNNVHISYRNIYEPILNYATNASGSWIIEAVDAQGGWAGDTSIAIDSNDNVHISYVDTTDWDIYSTDWDLKYATNAPGVQSVSVEDAYDVLTTDPTAVMFDTRTVDEHNGYCQPWDQNCGGQIDTDAAYAGTPQWAVGGVEKLAITLPYWYAGINRNTGPPEDEAQTRNIIEGALAANIIGFDTPIYLISSTAYRSYHMVAWMNSQTFTNPATNETSSFTNLFNIDTDGTPNNDQGGMQEWNAAGLPIFDGTIMPPQVLSGYPENGYIETSTNDVIFVAGVLEPTTGGFTYPDVTEVLLYVDGSSSLSMTQVDEAVLRAFFGIPDDVLIPGKVYMATRYLPDGIYTWNVKATNSAGTSWNLHVLNGTAQGPGKRTLTVDACSPSGDDTDCNGRDDDCDGVVDNNYLPTDTICGLGVCAATGLTKCIDGAEVDTCAPGTPAESPEATCDDNQDNDCDGLTDTDDSADCPLIYTITATAGSGGSISPSGDVIVDAGSDQTFTITPGRGYQVSDVLVDGVSVGRIISYTFTNVSSDHTISAEFTTIGIRRGMRHGRRGR